MQQLERCRSILQLGIFRSTPNVSPISSTVETLEGNSYGSSARSSKINKSYHVFTSC
jgi:hypothetical protein